EAPIDAKNHGVLFLNSAIRYEDIPDGSSQTIFLGEKLNDGLGEGWASGTRASLRNTGTPVNSRFNSPLAPGVASLSIGVDEDDETAAALKASPPGTPAFVGGFASRHPGGANCAFGDGSVRFLKTSVSPGILKLLGSRADGEILDSDKF